MSGYIGTQPVPQATQTRQTFVATAAQTSFATGGYSVGYLDVFLNGVKLQDGVDYTATNGSDIVLTVGAALDDTFEVVAYTAFEVLDQTFTGTTTTDVLTVTGAFTSKGIDDNATSTAMTLDSSGNVLVGTTDAAVGVGNTGTGHSLGGTGYATVSRTGTSAQATLYLNKNTNDGTIIDLRKDGTTVGRINSRASAVSSIVLDPRSGQGAGITGGGKTITPTNESGSNVDADIDLGQSANRWKDLYLSGGVHLGGTGAANKLDDYEEGTWTPNGGWSTNTAKYIKVGTSVTIILDLTSSTTASQISNLPFTCVTTTGTGIYTSLVDFAAGTTAPVIALAGSTIYFRSVGDNVSFSVMNMKVGSVVHASITYQTT
jgi:hypothetical protein